MPSYDVVIPCHDRAHVVADAVASVLRQAHPPARVVVVDDASGDGSRALIRRMEAEHASVRAPALPRNGGVARARNAGIAACVSPWIAFLDDDDVWTPGAAEALLGATDGRDVVVGLFARVEGDGPPGSPECGWDGGDIRAALRTGGVVGTSWSIVRHDAARDFAGFDPAFTSCEDWDFFTRLAAAGARFGRVDRLVAHYRAVAGGRMIEDDAALRENGARVLAHPYLAA